MKKNPESKVSTTIKAAPDTCKQKTLLTCILVAYGYEIIAAHQDYNTLL